MMIMTGRRFPAPGALVAIAVLGAGLAIWACRAQAAICDVCGRDECTALAFRIEYADGATQETCCPRCASHAVAEARGRTVSRLLARDFASGRQVDARSAVYVDGSDVEHCKAPREARSQEGCCRVLMYDRCLPSLIAFDARADADAFSRNHGGTIRTFEDLGFGRR